MYVVRPTFVLFAQLQFTNTSDECSQKRFWPFERISLENKKKMWIVTKCPKAFMIFYQNIFSAKNEQARTCFREAADSKLHGNMSIKHLSAIVIVHYAMHPRMQIV